jgi:hypothetical protein
VVVGTTLLVTGTDAAECAGAVLGAGWNGDLLW